MRNKAFLLFLNFFKFRVKRALKGNIGQAAVEYIMLVMVVAVLAMSIMQKVKGKLLAPCGENPKSLACMVESVFGNTNFTYFTLKQ